MRLRAAVFLVVLALAGCMERGHVSDPGKIVEAGAWHRLAVGQVLQLDGDSSVRRVPGGWVYLNVFPGADRGVCFIPYSEEGR